MSKMACAYIRVSTDLQEEYSPDAQLRLLKEYAAGHDIILTDIYQDLGISGRKADKRPQFQQMIAEAKSKEHPYDVILVWKFARFARNQEESIVYKALLKKNNVDVISVSEPLPDGFIGSLVERIFEWMDEYYSIRLSGEVKRGMVQKALSGGYNGQPPIGYKKEKGPDTIPYPDPYYAEMVHRCFYMFAVENRAFSQIAATVNNLGYRTRRGNKWESRNITDMIQNPFYIGKIRWNNAKNRSHKIEGETIIVDGRHEAIIDKQLWDKAKERYAVITASQSHSKRESIHKHWLSGILKCPSCGGSLAYQRGYNKRSGKEFPHFICWKSVKGLCDTRNSISVPKAETDVMCGLMHVVKNNVITTIAPIPSYHDDSAAIKKMIEAVNIKLKRIKAAYIDGVDTLDEYKANKQKLEKELAELEEKCHTPVTAAEPVTAEKIKSVYDFIEKTDIMDEKAAALHTIIDHIVYDKASDTMQFFFRN